MRFVVLSLFALSVTACGLTVKKDCEEKVYMGCAIGKQECGTDAKGCKQCQCVLK